MGVSENREPLYSTLNSRILIIRTPRSSAEGPPNATGAANILRPSSDKNNAICNYIYIYIYILYILHIL